MSKKRIISDFVSEDIIRKAAEGGARLQKIQMIVWDYMLLPKHKRDGVKMAMDISDLFEKDEQAT